MKVKVKKSDNAKDQYTIELPVSIFDLLNLDPEHELDIKTDGQKIIITQSCDELPPPTPGQEQAIILTATDQKLEAQETKNSDDPYMPPDENIYKKQLDYYWTMAADRQAREKFMGSMRPILRAKLGYDYSEVVCEEEARKLCRKYYMAQERGEELQPPYLPEI